MDWQDEGLSCWRTGGLLRAEETVVAGGLWEEGKKLVSPWFFVYLLTPLKSFRGVQALRKCLVARDEGL